MLNFLNMQGLSCHILSSVILARRVLDNLFFFFLFRCNFCCCFCMFFAIANDHMQSTTNNTVTTSIVTKSFVIFDIPLSSVVFV